MSQRFWSNRRIGRGGRNDSLRLHASVDEVIAELELNPSMPGLREKIQLAVLKDFPQVLASPTEENMEDSVGRELSSTKLKFEPGQWCEYLGLDMKWHLAQVKQVVKVAPRNWTFKADRNPDWDLVYAFPGMMDLVPKQRIRAPEEALKRKFGLRPWVWQQWAFLKVEGMVRFQRFHERDFETLSFGLTANLFFTQWLDDERNQDFKLFFDSRSQRECDQLVQHLLTPFVLMDEISKNPDGTWDFNKADNISLYQYVSLLGAGWLTCLGSLAVQCSIPILLLYEAVASSERFDLHNHTENSWERFCKPNEEFSDFDAGLVINIVVLLLYVMRNLPKVVLAYFDTMGEADTINSRVESLRTLVYYRGEATTGMRIGYRIERFMNSTYIALANTMMLFTLFLTDEASEIILNALAIEFVIMYAEEVVRMRWIDPYFRYLRAAATEMVTRYYLDPEVLSSPEKFCAEFDLPIEYYTMQLGHERSSASLCDSKQASLDKINPQYMLPKDKVWALAKNVAKRNHDRVAHRLFEKPIEKFDWVSRLVGIRHQGLFNRWPNYRTWSKWELVLFASPCGEDYLPPNLPSTTNKGYYLNEDAEYSSSDYAYWRFVRQGVSTLMCFRLAQSLRATTKYHSIYRMCGAIVDGSIEWFSVFYLAIFPLTFVFLFILQVGCY
ncbi:hypothetical protein BASA81_006703 [Batrachochytrium salamandrivorans]|nr:hypothetical protein BASA81_006703 [Batrachochytrium salamandrivorans]